MASKFLQQMAQQEQEREQEQQRQQDLVTQAKETAAGDFSRRIKEGPSGNVTENSPNEYFTRGQISMGRYKKARHDYDTYMASEEKREWDEQARTTYQEEMNEGQTPSYTTAYAAGTQAGMGTAAESMADPEEGKDPTEERLRENLDTARRESAPYREQQMMENDLREFASWTEEEQQMLIDYALDRDHELLADQPTWMNDAQTNVQPLIDRYGRETVEAIAESYMRSESQNLNADIAQWAQGEVAGNTGAAVGHSVLSVGANLIGNLASPAGFLQDATWRTGRYSTLNPYNAGQVFNTYSGAVRGQVEADTAENYGDVAGWGYQGIMSAADSMARIFATGGNAGMALGLAGMGSFGQSVAQASQQGATPEQAVIYGVGMAGLEMLTEKMPLDELLDLFKGNPQGTGAVLRKVGGQLIEELTGEEISLLGGLLWESAILQDSAAYDQRVNELMDGGMTEAQAREAASNEVWREVMSTAVATAVSVGASSGAAIGANKAGSLIEQLAEDMVRAHPPVEEARTELPEQSTAAIRATLGMDNATSDTAVTGQNHGLRYAASKVNSAILQMVDRVKRGVFKANEKVQLGKITDANAAQIQRETGIDVRGFDMAIEARQIDHILKGHGEKGNSNQSMADPTDIAKMEYALNEPDRIVKSGTTRAYVTNKDGRMKPADTVLYEKLLDDGSYYVVQAVPETKKKTLYIVTAFIGESGYKNTEAPQSTDMPDPGATPVAESADAPMRAEQSTNAMRPGATSKTDAVGTSKNIVPEKGAEVNGNSAEDIGMDHGAVGAAEKGFTGKAGYYDLLSEENAQRDREGDVRPVEVPKKDKDGRTVSEFVGNAYGSALTPDSFTDTIEKLVMEGKLSHDTLTNEQALQSAAQDIAEDGIYRSVQKIRESAQKGRTSADDVAKATLLYRYLTEQLDEQGKDGGEVDTNLQQMASDVFTSLTQMATNSGRSLQLFSMFRKMSPDGQILTIQNEIDRYVQRMKQQNRVGKDFTPQIDEDLTEEFRKASEENRKAKTKEDRDKSEQRMRDAQNAIYMSAAGQMPATFKAKWDAWRYMAMLGNVKTQVRNIGGNAAFMPYTEMKRILGTAFESLLPKDQRTKAILGFSKSDRELLNWAKADAKNADVNNALKYSAKLGDDVTHGVMQEGIRVFDNQLLESFRKVSEAVPAGADMLFKNHEYSRSMAGFLKARGFTAADVQAGKVDSGTLEAARNYAIAEAMKATFNDSNAFSDFMANGLRYKGDNPIGKAVNIFGEGVLPFRKTPANIVVRLVENSPAGLAKGLWNMATKVRSGEVSAATAIDQMAAGMTGTGMMVLGYFLASGAFGIRLRGSEVEDEEKEQGHQTYALEFTIDGKDYSYKIDWCAPANLPLFIGANLHDAIAGGGGDESLTKFTSVVYAMGTAFEPLLSLSCMSSLNDIVESAKYAEDGEALYALAVSAGTSYLTQGIPALLRQTEQATQENQQQTFANSEDPLIRDIQRTVANIPFVGQALGLKVDKIDDEGEEVSRGGIAERLLNAFLNPGTLKAIDTDAVDEERQRLGEAQEGSVSPRDVPKTITYTDTDGQRHENHRLTAEEYETYAQVQGQTQDRILSEIVESEDYAALTDEQKAEVFGLAYDYAREKAREAALDGYEGGSSWMEGIEGNEGQAIIEKVVADSFDDAFSGMTAGWRNGTDTEGSVEALEEAYGVFDGLDEDTQAAIVESSGGRLEAYFKAREAGIDTETFTEYYGIYYDIGQQEEDQDRQATLWANELQKAVEAGDLTREEADILQESMKYWYQVPATAAHRYDALVDGGISADDAMDLGYLLEGLEPEQGFSDIRPVQQAETILDADLGRRDTEAALRIYLSDAQDENLDEMLEMGFSAQDYVTAWRLYLDYTSGSGKKKRTIEKYMEEFGVDYDTAKAIYEIYG